MCPHSPLMFGVRLTGSRFPSSCQCHHCSLPPQEKRQKGASCHTIHHPPAFVTLPLFNLRSPVPRPLQVTAVVLKHFSFPPWSTADSPAPLLHLVLSYRASRAGTGGRRRGRMVRRMFRLSDMIPNAWFYKLRDMGAHGRGGVGVHHRSSSARSYQQPPSARGSSARWSVEAVQRPPSSGWYREVSNDIQQPEADVEPPVTPTKESPRAPLPRRASYYYSTRDREVPAPPAPKPPRVKDAQSPTRRSRRRHKVDHAPEERGPARGKEPVVGALGSSGRRRDMCIKSDGGEPRRPTVRGPADDGRNVKVIASHNEIIIDLRDEDTPGRRLRPIVTKPARRRPVPNEQDGSQADLADVTARASSASDKSSVSRLRRSSASSSGRRRLKTLSKSPRLAATARKVHPPSRKWTAPLPPLLAPVIVSSYPVVKMSEDPRQDFRESMEEMISAKGIQDAEDLEDLLACYLSLNDAAHHDLIIDVFEQIWVSLAGARP
ncbi:transcription repressor OFP3-like [Triticum dicoccoides]|uniref:transcription repressor OFP3-like n=1 Tax=Triticum dicoccoides TaxID=85692 RepID=UPI00188F5EB6|nr:transcription repressor OFP3-like [Triticum dicoccoides]